MSDELNEEQSLETVDSQIQESDVDPNVELDIEALKAKADKADEYKRYADRVSAENKTLKKSRETLQTNESSNKPEDIERLRLEVKGYKGDEVEFLMQNGGVRALDNEIAMAGIEAIRKKSKSTEATPSGTAKSTVYQKYTERDLKNMPASELEKIIPQ